MIASYIIGSEKIPVEIKGSSIKLIREFVPSSGLMGYASVYFGDSSSGSADATKLDVSNFSNRLIVIKNSYDVDVKIDIIRFFDSVSIGSTEIMRVNNDDIIIKAGETKIIDKEVLPLLNINLQFLQIRISRYNSKVPTSGNINVKIYGSNNVSFTNNNIIEDNELKKIHRANFSWWCNEHSIIVNDTQYIGYITDCAEKCIVSFKPKSNNRDFKYFKLNDIFDVDEHNAPAIVALKDNRIGAFYTGHDSRNKVYFRISKSPNDISDFEIEKEITFPEHATYAQAHSVNGSIWLFTRVNYNSWYFTKSDDNCETWSNPIKVLEPPSGGRYYITTRPYKTPTDYISLICTGHPLQSPDNIIRASYIKENGEITLFDGTIVGNVITGTNLPIQPSDLQTIYTPASGKTTRLLDVSLRYGMRIAFATFDKESPHSNPVYGYAKHTGGGVWKVNDNVINVGGFLAPEQTDGSETYVPGVAFTNDYDDIQDKMYIARFEDGRSLLELYSTNDSGDSWVLEEVVRKAPKGEKLWRPTVPHNALDNCPVFWMEGKYKGHTRLWKSDIYLKIKNDL